MAIETTYTKARAELAKLCDAAINDRDVVIINRRGREGVALIAVSELSSLMETSHLLRSPANAERLLAALQRARTRKGRARSLAELRDEVNLEQGS